MDSKLDTVREALKSVLDEYWPMGSEEAKSRIVASKIAALSAIDPEAHGCDELVEKVITFFNNRVTIGETEDECGDLVSVLELDKDFRTDLAKMLFAIDHEAIRRECADRAKRSYLRHEGVDGIVAVILSAIANAEKDKP